MSGLLKRGFRFRLEWLLIPIALVAYYIGVCYKGYQDGRIAQKDEYFDKGWRLPQEKNKACHLADHCDRICPTAAQGPPNRRFVAASKSTR